MTLTKKRNAQRMIRKLRAPKVSATAFQLGACLTHQPLAEHTTLHQAALPHILHPFLPVSVRGGQGDGIRSYSKNPNDSNNIETHLPLRSAQRAQHFQARATVLTFKKLANPLHSEATLLQNQMSFPAPYSPSKCAQGTGNPKALLNLCKPRVRPQPSEAIQRMKTVLPASTFSCSRLRSTCQAERKFGHGLSVAALCFVVGVPC